MHQPLAGLVVDSVISSSGSVRLLPVATRPAMEDLTFAYLDGGRHGGVVLLSSPGTVKQPTCEGLRVFRWLFCGLTAEANEGPADKTASSGPKELWYQCDYEEEPAQTHKEKAPLLVGPAKL